MHRGGWSSALGSYRRREVLRTNLWVVPSIEVAGAIVLFAVTLTLDHHTATAPESRPADGWLTPEASRWPPAVG